VSTCIVSLFIGSQEQLRQSATSYLLSDEQVPSQAPHIMLQSDNNLATTQECTQLASRHHCVCYSYSTALRVASLSCLPDSPYCSITMPPALLLQCCNFNLPSAIKACLK